VRGRAEWGVKALWRAPRPAAATAAAVPSGAAYLQGKLAARDAGEERRDSAEHSAAAIHAELARLADDAVLLRPQDPRLSGLEGEMLLNAAYLVAAPERFGDAVAACQERPRSEGLHLRLTGPWPAYHFVAEPPS